MKVTGLDTCLLYTPVVKIIVKTEKKICLLCNFSRCRNATLLAYPPPHFHVKKKKLMAMKCPCVSNLSTTALNTYQCIHTVNGFNSHC